MIVYVHVYVHVHKTLCFYRTCVLVVLISNHFVLQDNTIVPATPLFSAKILQEDKDMWLDVQVIILAAFIMSAVLSYSYLFVKGFHLYVCLFVWFQVKWWMYIVEYFILWELSYPCEVLFCMINITLWIWSLQVNKI